MPAEAPLLQRSRELRARIEQPGRTAQSAPEASGERATVVSEVRHALLMSSTSAAVRATLVSWVGAALAAVIKRLVFTATRTPPSQETVRAAGAEIAVTPSGADPGEVASGLGRLQALHRVPSTWLIGSSVATGVALLLTLVLAVVGSDWAWLTAVLAVAAAIGAGQQLRQRRMAQRDEAAARRLFQEQLSAATERVSRAEEQRSAALVRLTGEAAALKAQLPQPVSPAAQPVSSGDQAGG
ncbi:MAG TPA: hypothetical protein VFR88_09690, partial [Microlunatus sp.]|nr:hypothetical protein [Microlunatus sp.]